MPYQAIRSFQSSTAEQELENKGESILSFKEVSLQIGEMDFQADEVPPHPSPPPNAHTHTHHYPGSPTKASRLTLVTICPACCPPPLLTPLCHAGSA